MHRLLYLFTIIFIFGCSQDDSSSDDDCTTPEVTTNNTISISKITQSRMNGQLLNEYFIGSNNRIMNYISYGMSETNHIYSYNECNQLTKIERSFNGSELFDFREFRYNEKGNFSLFLSIDFRYEYEYQDNKVTYSEYRPIVNSRRELIFDENGNAIKEIDLLADNLETNITYDNNNNWLSSDWDTSFPVILGYNSELNPFHLINANTYGSLNHKLLNFGFNKLRNPFPDDLVVDGISPSLLSEYEALNSMHEIDVLETSNGYATKFVVTFTGEANSSMSIFEVELQ